MCRYVSKEVLREDLRHLDKADMFALGASLYELASDKRLPKGALCSHSGVEMPADVQPATGHISHCNVHASSGGIGKLDVNTGVDIAGPRRQGIPRSAGGQTVPASSLGALPEHAQGAGAP